MLAADPAVRQFQVRGLGDGVVVLLVLQGDEAAACERIGRAVAARLEAAGVARPKVRTEPVAAIGRSPGGKLRLVVPEEARAPTLA